MNSLPGGWGRHACVLLLVTATGCGSGETQYAQTDLQGTVTVRGEPIPSGSIRFLPESGAQGPAVGAEVVQGCYSAARVPLGQVRVVVAAIRKVRELPPDQDGRIDWEIENLIPSGKRQGVVVSIESKQRRLDLAW